MTEWHFALMALSLAAAFVAAAVVGRRSGDDQHDTRLVLACGAAIGGLALVLFALSELT